MSPMPTNLHRYHAAGYLHFVTTSCYQRRPLLGTVQNRDLFLDTMEQVRRRYRFVIARTVDLEQLSPLRHGQTRTSADQSSTEIQSAGAKHRITNCKPIGRLRRPSGFVVPTRRKSRRVGQPTLAAMHAVAVE